MPAKKKTVRRPRRPAAVRKARRSVETRLHRTWKDARAALSSAETDVEKGVRALIKRSGFRPKQAAALLREWNARLDRERRKMVRDVEGRLALLQARARKERRVLARTVNDAVQTGLATLNIPSRREVQDLTRKVDELSRKIDRIRR
jgi:hypothetical protein